LGGVQGDQAVFEAVCRTHPICFFFWVLLSGKKKTREGAATDAADGTGMSENNK
jgi:hypothetical protein